MPWSIAMMNRLVLAASIGATALAGCAEPARYVFFGADEVESI